MNPDPSRGEDTTGTARQLHGAQPPGGSTMWGRGHARPRADEPGARTADPAARLHDEGYEVGLLLARFDLLVFRCGRGTPRSCAL
jgi:hypothetical protein